MVISVATDTESKVTTIILRDVRETKKESFENLDGSSEIKDASSVLNLARIVSPDLEIETLEEIECDDIKVDNQIVRAGFGLRLSQTCR